MEASEALSRCNRMWKRLGGLFERAAYERAATQSGLNRPVAIQFAQAAEACFWQATGEADTFDFERKPV